VPEAAALRIDLLASRRARRVRALARALTAVAAAGCIVAALLAPSSLRIGAALASAGAFVLTRRGGRARRSAARLAIGADGAIRDDTAAADGAATVLYCGSSFVCLQTARGPLALWRDSMAAAAWRRLAVACRWPHRREGAVSLADPRTK
jgi:hypothetical protein